MCYRSATRLPVFFVAPDRMTGGWFSRMDTGGLTEAEKIVGPKGGEYGVWLTDGKVTDRDPALSAILDVLTALETQIGSHAQLFSATSRDREICVALSFDRDLFRIGGLLASEERTTQGIKDAIDDLNIPLRIVSMLLEAERKTARVSG